MKSLISIIGFILLTTSCELIKRDYYFDFDHIDYYFIEIEEREIMDVFQQDDLSKQQKLQVDIVINNTPKSQIDTSFISKLDKIGFTQKLIKKEQLPAINEIFREKPKTIMAVASCIAIYRDVLVFRKNGKIVGLSKICFGCQQQQIIGTKANTTSFGHSEDYEKLARILKE